MAPPPFLASWSDQGVYKHNTSPLQALIRSTMGGALLGLAGLTCLIVNGSLTALNALYPGVGKLVFAMLFAVGIYMVIMLGGDLATSNMGILVVSILDRKIPWWAYFSNLAIVTVGNFAGSLTIAALLGVGSGLLASDPTAGYVNYFVIHKAIVPNFGQILARGIGCNLLVVIAVAQSCSAVNTVDKFFAIYPPIVLFVACGYDHVVANMFFIPCGYMLAPGSFSFGTYLWQSFIASWIGNAIGAILIVVPMYYAYREKKTLDDASSKTSMNSSEKHA